MHACELRDIAHFLDEAQRFLELSTGYPGVEFHMSADDQGGFNVHSKYDGTWLGLVGIGESCGYEFFPEPESSES